MIVRRFNEVGISKLGEFLDSLTSPAPLPWPGELLSDPDCTDPLDSEIEVAARDFEDRQQVGEYLFGLFEDSELENIERDRGMWAWLALFFFPQLCIRSEKGCFKPGERARWIPAFSDFQKYYRHLLAGPYRIYRAYREHPEKVRALLCTPPHSPGELVEQLASRQELVTNEAVMEMATELYINMETGHPKKGARGKGAGSVRRLADVLGQFDLTWDLYSMNSLAIQEMLPSEFDRFIL